MQLNYVIYRYDNESVMSTQLNINKVYATGSVTLSQIRNGYINNKYPELFTSNFYCNVVYFLPTIQPSLWDKEKFY